MKTKAKTYVEFYQEGIDWKNIGVKPIIPMCGSGSINYIDGRLSRINMIERARVLAKTNFKSKYIIGFELLRGANILDAKEITDLIRVQF